MSTLLESRDFALQFLGSIAIIGGSIVAGVRIFKDKPIVLRQVRVDQEERRR